MSGTAPELPADPQAYIARVMDEIAETARLQRSAGDLPPKLEHDLDELFLAHSPVAGHGGALADALRMVDARSFVDPVVPVESNRAAGVLVKKGMRSLLLWYVGWVTHQMSQSGAAVSRALHIVEERLGDLDRQVELQHAPPAGVVEIPGLIGQDAWWVEPAVAALSASRGRVMHAACGDGWLVRRLVDNGCDAYGVDPRQRLIDEAARGAVELRAEELIFHLRSVAPEALGGAVLSGVIEGMGAGQRSQLMRAVVDALAPAGTLVLHSATSSAWDSEGAPPEVDLAPGRPIRPAAWCHLLDGHGFEAEVRTGPGGGDYVVTAVRKA